jgi:hypothetical protein
VICFVFCILISPSSSPYELKAIFALMSQIRLSLLDGDKNNINYVFFVFICLVVLSLYFPGNQMEGLNTSY